MVLKDISRIKRLGRYLRQDKKRLLAILFLLLPLSFAGAVQPLLVGQAISLLKGEATFLWLSNFTLSQSMRILISCLLFSVLVRLAS